MRVSVEWVFGDVINYCKFLGFGKNSKIQLSAVGKMRIHVFMEIQLLHSLIVTHQVHKNIFNSELNLPLLALGSVYVDQGNVIRFVASLIFFQDFLFLLS